MSGVGGSTPWSIRIAAAAESGFEGILKWTGERFGARQAANYRNLILDALAALEHGPDTVGVRQRPDILPGLRTLHVSRAGRRGRHFILLRASADHTIEVLRILHDSMDFARHLNLLNDQQEGE